MMDINENMIEVNTSEHCKRGNINIILVSVWLEQNHRWSVMNNDVQ